MTRENNLERLRELTSRLPGMNGFEQARVGGVTILEAEGGQVFVFELLATDGIKVLHVFMPEGTKLGMHTHADRYEVNVVSEGKVYVEWRGREGELMSKMLSYGHTFYALPGQEHSSEALEDSWIVVGMVPHPLGGEVGGHGC